MAELKVDGRIDNYRVGQDSWAETRPGTPLVGVKLGKKGEDLTIGGAFRAQISFEGRRSDPFEVVVRAHIVGVDRKPLILLEESDDGFSGKRQYLVPQAAIGRKRSVSLIFSAKPPVVEIKKYEPMGPADVRDPGIPLCNIGVGQILGGANERGQRRRFLVAAINEENGRPILETLDKTPQRVRSGIDGNNLISAGEFEINRVLTDIRSTLIPNRLAQDPG